MASGVIDNMMADGVTWNRLTGTTACYYAKKNGLVSVVLDGVGSLTGNSWTNIGTFPQEYAPSQRIYFICGDGGSNVTLVEIATTGVIRAKPITSGTHYAYGAVSYPV